MLLRVGNIPLSVAVVSVAVASVAVLVAVVSVVFVVIARTLVTSERTLDKIGISPPSVEDELAVTTPPGAMRIAEDVSVAVMVAEVVAGSVMVASVAVVVASVAVVVASVAVDVVSLAVVVRSGSERVGTESDKLIAGKVMVGRRPDAVSVAVVVPSVVDVVLTSVVAAVVSVLSEAAVDETYSVVVTMTTVSVGVDSVAEAVLVVVADVLASPNKLEKKSDNENGSLSLVPAVVDALLRVVDWTGALVMVVFVICRFTCRGK